MAKKNTANVATASTILTDSAFVPDMTERQQELTMSQKLHNEAGDVVESKMDDMEISIQLGYRGIPQNGEHVVKIVDVKNCKGKNGKPDFDVITFRDVVDDVEWDKLVSFPDYNEELGNINYYNNGIFRQLAKAKKLTKNAALELLKRKQFKVWTQRKDGVGNALTYFNEQKYQRYCMALSYKTTASAGKSNIPASSNEEFHPSESVQQGEYKLVKGQMA